jgi:hypothetical protein
MGHNSKNKEKWWTLGKDAKKDFYFKLKCLLVPILSQNVQEYSWAKTLKPKHVLVYC